VISADQQPVDCGQADRALLQQFRAGDSNAAAILYRRYARRLRDFARVNCSLELSSRLEPDDIVQAVFMAFFEQAARGKYQDAEDKDLWKLLAVIALNHIRTAGAHHRAAKRDVRLTRTGSEPGLNEACSPEDEKALNELRLFLGELMKQLPTHQQRVIELRLEGYEVAEIADLTGQSQRTVERGLHNFRSKIYEKWDSCPEIQI
jgi:RNA polymerase sigma factor (sigma-70 family)